MRTTNRDAAYSGAERRQYRVLLTRNTEYHLRGDCCVAVRDRRTDSWLEGHLALGGVLAGAVRLAEDGDAEAGPSEPEVGQALFFSGASRDLITSALDAVERPDPRLVAQYPH